MPRGEEALVAWLRARIGSPIGRATIGDDTATLPQLSRRHSRWVATVDQQIAGVHFVPDLDPAWVARRLLAVNLSDLAASGARPRIAFSTVAAPAGFALRHFLAALADACAEAGVVLAGGDVAASPLVATTLLLLGERRPGGATLARDRARVGHRLWLGGTLGESALGRALVARGARPRGRGVRLPSDLELGPASHRAAVAAVRRHLAPEPQLALGRWLAREPRAGAAIDLSDGFAKDLHRLADASEVGFRLDRAAVEAATAPEFVELARRLALDPLVLELEGGEDYALLFTLPATIAPPRRFACRPIGQAIRRAGAAPAVAWSNDGRPIPRGGHDHLAAMRESAP